MGDSLLDLATKRQGVLAALADGPGHKRDVEAEVDVSRSTVDRAIDELLERDLVSRADGRYRTTPLGEVALATVRESTETLATAEAARDLLNALPGGITVPPAVLRDATVRHPQTPAPLRGLDDVVDHVRRADQVRGITRTYTSQDNAAAFRDSALEGGLSLELVMDAEVLAYCEEVLFDRERVLESEGTRLWAHPDPPFGLYLVADGDGETLYVVCYGADSEYVGHLETAAPAALAWGESVFEDARSEATPYAEWRAER